MIRKHVKVEPARWYYWCDRLGMLVWQDMPSGDNDDRRRARTTSPPSCSTWSTRWRNHPSIVMWVPFNEGWGQHDTEKTVAWLKAYDPTRLVNNASGWTDQPGGRRLRHARLSRPGHAAARGPTRAACSGEFGGLGLPLAGHTWVDRNNWGYRSFPDTAALGAAYRDLLRPAPLPDRRGLSAAVYTQTTDVEVEVNGLMTYDRAVVKLPADAIAAAKSLFTPMFTIRAVLPTSQREGQHWKYTTTAPAEGWFAPGYDAGLWQDGVGGFGKPGTPGAVIRTTWTTPDIWLRRTFELTSTGLVEPHWRIHHDEDAEVYLNGQLVGRFSGYTSGYQRIPLEPAARAALRVGINTIAVHVHQTTGGQYIDLGLDEVITP